MARSEAVPASRPLYADEGDEEPAVTLTGLDGGDVGTAGGGATSGGATGAGATSAGATSGGEVLREEEIARPVEASEESMPVAAPESYPTEDVDAVRTETASTGSMGGMGSYTPPPNLGGSVAVEPLPWVPLDPAPVPAGPRRVLLATMEVPPGRTIFPPVSACQDVLVYVEDGTLEAMGTGVGSTDAPATLYAGDAVRFGPEGDGRLTNRSGLPASALVVIARAASAGAPLYTSPVDAGLCDFTPASDPLVRPSRLASAATTAPLVVMDGHLEVRILLDLEGTAAEHAGLAVLTGDETMEVAAHVHDLADEVLYVEEGEGVLTLGERSVEVHPGSVLYIPHGIEHAFQPSGDVGFRAIQLYAPSGPEQRFRGLAGAP